MTQTFDVHPLLIALRDLWDGLRSGRDLPRRADLDPLALRRWLGQLALLEVVEGGLDFRYRVHGTVLAERIGMDLTGRLLSSVDHVLVEQVFVDYREAVNTRAPVFRPHSSATDRPNRIYDKLILPFAGQDGEVTQLLAGIVIAAER